MTTAAPTAPTRDDEAALRDAWSRLLIGVRPGIDFDRAMSFPHFAALIRCAAEGCAGVPLLAGTPE